MTIPITAYAVPADENYDDNSLGYSDLSTEQTTRELKSYTQVVVVNLCYGRTAVCGTDYNNSPSISNIISAGSPIGKHYYRDNDDARLQ